jgi:hypothetical protein
MRKYCSDQKEQPMSFSRNGPGILFSLLQCALVSMSLSAQAALSSAEVTVEKSSGGAIVKIDGQLFTEYLVDSEGKPILWPIIGPTGKAMTRAFPMQKYVDQTPREKTDHPHHRSMWFTHGSVNGIDFWSETRGHGTTKHRDSAKLESGETGLIVTDNDWVSSDGTRQCEDQRRLRFGADAKCRWIDFDITIAALDRPVAFGDTKEGAFGLRLAETLTVDAKQGGEIVNSNGLGDKAAWGKRADWVDCHGPLGGQIVGVAVLNHPGSFAYPTYWHVRTYGLLAANPFGERDFTGDSRKDGSYTIRPGERIRLRYRVLFHLGDEKAGNVAEAFSSYAKTAE